MLRVLIEKEVRDLLGSAKFLLAFVVCAALILLAFYAGADNYKVANEHYEAAKAENLRKMEGVTDWLMLRDHRVFLPPQPLATLVNGVSNDIGRTTDMEARGELVAHDSRYNEEPLFAVFRFLDLAFIFEIVLSLLAILIGYDAICGEKEQGTLKLALANAVPRSSFIIGKLLGLYVTISTALLLAVGASSLLLPIMGVPMSSTDWLRLGMIVFMGLLYFGAFLTMSLFVSSFSHRTSSAFLVMLVIWIGAVLINPRASVLLAGRAIEVPSVDEVAAKKATFDSGLWKNFKAGMSSFRPAADIPKDDPEAMMTQFNKYVDSLTNVRDEAMNEFAGRLNEDRRNRQQVQQSVAYTLARVSPATSLSLATSELAGTSMKLQERYLESALTYQKEYAAFMHEKTGMNVGGRMIVMKISTDDEEETVIDPTELPAFVYEPESLAESIKSAAPDVGLLALFNIIFFAGAFLGFNRYDAR